MVRPIEHRHSSSHRRSTPGVLAPVRVILSRSINTYSTPSAPLAGTPRFRFWLIRSALAWRERQRRPTRGSELLPNCPCPHVVLSDPGKSAGCHTPSSTAGDAGLAPSCYGFGTPDYPTNPLRVGTYFRGSIDSLILLQPADLLASLADLTRPFDRANGDVYARASDGLVTRTAAEYDYRGNWAISTGRTFTCWTFDYTETDGHLTIFRASARRQRRTKMIKRLSVPV